MNKKEMRARFRDAVFRRDNNRCVMCGVSASKAKLDAHHIVDRHDMPNGGYVVENGITLCDQPGGCHEKAEAFHRGDLVQPGFMPEELYQRIASNYDEAFAASVDLRQRPAGDPEQPPRET